MVKHKTSVFHSAVEQFSKAWHWPGQYTYVGAKRVATPDRHGRCEGFLANLTDNRAIKPAKLRIGFWKKRRIVKISKKRMAFVHIAWS